MSKYIGNDSHYVQMSIALTVLSKCFGHSAAIGVVDANSYMGEPDTPWASALVICSGDGQVLIGLN